MIIKVEDLSFTYMSGTPFEKRALDGVNVVIEEGEFVTIIGATGSGKSTFIQHLNALIKCVNGRIIVDGIDLTAPKPDLKRLRRTVGMVFQYPEYQLFGETVIKDIAFGPKNLGFFKDETAELVKEAIELVGLDYEDVAERSPFDLSGGEKRRVALAGVIAMKPKILILDEPTAGLDPLGRQEVLKLIKRIRQASTPTIIAVSHDIDEVAGYTDRFLVMSEGRIVLDAPTDRLYEYRELLAENGLVLPTTLRIKSELEGRGINIPAKIKISDFVNSIEEIYRQKQEESISL